MKQKKTLLLILGVLLAAAAAVGLYFGVKALSRSSGTPTGTGNPAVTGGASEQPGQPAATDPITPVETTEPAWTGTYVPPEAPGEGIRSRYVYTDENAGGDDSRWDLTVASCGEQSISNRVNQVFYYFEFMNTMNQYGYFASMLIDTTKPLSEQAYNAGMLTGETSELDDLNWEQVILLHGLDSFHEYAAVSAKAKAEGFTLPEEDEAQLEQIISNLPDDAKEQGFDSVEAYLQSGFGPGITAADYEVFLRLYFPAMAYEMQKYESIDWTDEDLRAYVEAHPEQFPDVDFDTPNINVRHILFLSDADDDGEATDEEKAAAKEKADALLAEFLKAPSEDAFAALAGENSEDPGSKDNGGLYEDVAPGQMVQSFNDWCFDPARKSGDTAVVETEYGFHVMYFVGQTENYQWKTEAAEYYPQMVMNTWIQEIMDAAPMEANYENIVLAPLPKPAEDGAE